jgi:hypothetical protein
MEKEWDKNKERSPYSFLEGLAPLAPTLTDIIFTCHIAIRKTQREKRKKPLQMC